MQRCLLILLIVAKVSVAEAQRPHIGLWTGINMPISFAKHWQWHNDAGYRTLGVSAKPLQYLYRPGLRYIINNKWNVASGVAFFFTKTDFDKNHHEFGKEFRIWQEGQFQQSTGSLQLQIRLRTEQRFFSATTMKNKYTAHRFRIKAGATKKITSKWALQLANEYMQQIKVGSSTSFDQNRVVASALYKIGNTTQLQAGYMWLKWPDASQHILSITVTKNIKLYERKKAGK